MGCHDFLDFLVSSLAIHNIPSKADRRKAIVEGFRVLKPGGRIVIADIRTTALYEEALRELGASKVERRRLGWRFWWGNPIAATTLLTASKRWSKTERTGRATQKLVEQHRPEASPASDGGVRCRELPVNGTICTACQVVPPPLLAGLGPSVRLRSDSSTFSTTSAAVPLPCRTP